MSVITIEMPEEIQQQAAHLAAAEGLSLDQFFALAAQERIAARQAADTLESLAAQADEAAFQRVIAKVPPGGPEEEWDRLPPGWKRP